jgi:hypothetical protein
MHRTQTKHNKKLVDCIRLSLNRTVVTTAMTETDKDVECLEH